MEKQKKKAYEIVVNKIEQYFVKGKLKAGDQLPSERELANQFNVSRTSVREGLRTLEHNGIIEIKRGQGSFIKTTHMSLLTDKLSSTILQTEDDLVYEMLEFRQALEVESAYLAAQRATSEELKKIKQALEMMGSSKGDVEKGVRADLQFHIAIVEATHNTVFINLSKTLYEYMEDTIRATRRHRLSDPSRYEDTFKEHKDIYVAIASGDQHQAKQLMKEHIIQIRRELSESLLSIPCQQ